MPTVTRVGQLRRSCAMMSDALMRHAGAVIYTVQQLKQLHLHAAVDLHGGVDQGARGGAIAPSPPNKNTGARVHIRPLKASAVSWALLCPNAFATGAPPRTHWGAYSAPHIPPS